ncbi:hypothetical protein [Streptomyces sp. NPDC088910]|uniref:hypothetical protein n=1 Tax=Streptomyces sp. NPDC088910 TaxID=3365911 RepID=UPI0037F79D58
MDDGRDVGTWPDPVTAERLLSVVTKGECPAEPGTLHEVADARFFTLLRLLTAASGDTEVDPEREQAALAAFRAARRTGGADEGRRLVVSGRSAKALAGGLVAVFAVSGVAVAAGTGVLPGPFRGGAFHAGPLAAGGAGGTADGPGAAVPRTTSPPAPGTDAPRGASPSPTGDDGGHRHGDPRAPHHPGPYKPSDRNHQAVLKALCRGYTQATRHGGHADPWLVARLQGEAGRKERIADYCRRVLAHGQSAPAATTDPVDTDGYTWPTGGAPTGPGASAPPSPGATDPGQDPGSGAGSNSGSEQGSGAGSNSGSDDSSGQGKSDENATHDHGSTVR